MLGDNIEETTWKWKKNYNDNENGWIVQLMFIASYGVGLD